jgi:hypothetical protein
LKLFPQRKKLLGVLHVTIILPDFVLRAAYFTISEFRGVHQHSATLIEPVLLLCSDTTQHEQFPPEL